MTKSPTLEPIKKRVCSECGAEDIVFENCPICGGKFKSESTIMIKPSKRKVNKSELRQEKIQITYDKNSAKFVWKAINKTLPEHKCKYCGKRLNFNNVGIITNKFMVCQNVICLIKFEDEI